MAELKELLEPVSKLVKSLDLKQAAAAEAALEKAFPSGSPGVRAIAEAAKGALAAGAICGRGEPGMKFSRVVKPEQDAGGCSIDAVFMENASGPAHTHTKGEVCLCIPQEGQAQFEGRTATWIVMPAGSRHVPTVKGGSMLILYWWPEGAVAWG